MKDPFCASFYSFYNLKEKKEEEHHEIEYDLCGECDMVLNENKVCEFCKKLNLCINCEDLVEEKLDCGYCNKCSSQLQEIEKPKKILKKKIIPKPK